MDARDQDSRHTAQVEEERERERKKKQGVSNEPRLMTIFDWKERTTEKT